MLPPRNPERGEGRIGCIVTLLFLIIAGGICVKVLPVLYNNNELVTTAEDLGSRAGILSPGTVEAQLRSKASELEINEALEKGAMVVDIQGTHDAGTATIRLKYTRKVDLFGIYTLPISTDKKVVRPYRDTR